MAATADPEQREAMLRWTSTVVDRREQCAIGRRPGPGIPTQVAQVEGTDAFMIFSIANQFHAVVIQDIVDVPPS